MVSYTKAAMERAMKDVPIPPASSKFAKSQPGQGREIPPFERRERWHPAGISFRRLWTLSIRRGNFCASPSAIGG